MRIFLLVAIVILSASCGNTAQPPAATAEQPAAETAVMEESATGPVDPKTKIDPVCGMEWEAEWTDFSVYNGDTLRFCGDGCKKAFEARPAKYVTSKM